ncbi:glycoside hydrolase family 18 protein [Gracilibacillus sp. HCP3S3_G5_1]|uniref:glycoside hydrolase family 18 protein n=1 Tax=unclassified Gracilibacillus TaxID=2625209 RepID=UPI003F8B7EF9
MIVKAKCQHVVKWLVSGCIGMMIVAVGLLFLTKEEITAAESGNDYRIVGYYTQWSTYGRDFQVIDIDASKLTHIVYAFADYCWEGEGHSDATDCEEVPNGTVVSADPWADFQNPNVLGLTEDELEDWDRDFYGNLGGLAILKDENPGLRTLLSIGGWTFSKNFSNIAASDETRRTFAKSAVAFMRTYEMDGVDIDWEYPVSGGHEGNIHRPEDKQNHTLLLQEIRKELDKAEKEDGKKYELAIASSANPSYLENNEMAKIAEIVDFIDIMTYDFNGSWQSTSAHNAPLFADPAASEAGVPGTEVFNVATAIEGHLHAGVPANKLVMGLPFYGRSWASCDNTEAMPNGGYYHNCQGAGNGTWEAGVYDYDDIIQHKLTDDQYVAYWNDVSKVPYLFNEETGEFISYDDEQSIAEKVAYAENLQLGGAMIWELSADRDSRLLSVIFNEFTNKTVPPLPTPNDGTIRDMSELTLDNNQYIFNNPNHFEKLVFNASLIEQLQEDSELVIHYRDIVMEVPVALIQTEQNITFQFAEAEEKIKRKFDNHVSPIYDLTILSGDQLLSNFDKHSIKLIFSVDKNQIENWDRLAVYLLDDNGEKQQEIDVAYDKVQQIVMANVSHFSLYGVFQRSTPKQPSDDNKQDEKKIKKGINSEPPKGKKKKGNTADMEKKDNDKALSLNSQNEQLEGQRLPDTATNLYNYMVIGLLLVAISGMIFFLSRFRKHD